MFAWGGWSLIAGPTPRVYEVLGISPCSGNATCLRLNGEYADGWPLVVLIALCASYLVGVFIVQRGLTGRTVGSMLFMFEVVGEDHRPLGVGRAALRSLAGAVDYLPCCVPIVGIVTIAATPTRQRVGDLAAGSIVVEARRNTEHSGAPPSPIPPTPSNQQQPGRPLSADESLPPRPPTMAAQLPPRTPGPLWDPSRGAHVLWDDAGSRWLVFDVNRQLWVVLRDQ